MREIKVAVREEWSSEVVQIALQCGVKTVSISEIVSPPATQPRKEVKIKTSSPIARRFLENIYQTAFYSSSDSDVSISSHNIRGLETSETVFEATKPFCVPFIEVYEDLWQSSHVTTSFVLRVVVSAMLLTYAMLTSQVILMIGAMLFTLFSPALMAIGLGISMRETHLIRQAAKAFVWANVLSILAAAGIAFVMRRPLIGMDFGSWMGNIFISLAAGAVGAIADVDDAGRRQLIAIAAAFPYSRFPPWIGICFVNGFPPLPITLERLGIFTVNIVSMVVSAAVAYRCIGANSRSFFKSRTK